MKSEAALSRYYAEREIRPEGTNRDDWLKERWYRVGGVPGIPILPLVGGLKQTLILHDVHHLVTGYATDWDGELQLAGWELGSGGCGWSLVFWFDRLGAFAAGLLLAPRLTLRAFQRGLRERNLYGRSLDTVLESDVEELRASLA
jgi:hypothetical protein